MVVEAKEGERVEVVSAGKTYVGQIMKRPVLAGRGCITLKLDSGYDIGIDKSNIHSIKIIGGGTTKQMKQPPTQVDYDPEKPTVSVLSTGGTIASKVDYTTGGVSAAITAEDLVAAVPELTGLANIKATSIMNVMSEDMTPKLWVKMAEAAAKELAGPVDGVVITHGTDTMGYSAAALSFMLRGLNKPVVLTGAQRSTDRGSADSYLNLLCSVAFAKSGHAGVFVVMHGSISDTYCLAHIGTRVRKMHTTRRDAFRSVNAEPVAKIYSDGRVDYNGSVVVPSSGAGLTVDSKLEERVALVKVYPGIDPGIFDYYLDRGVRGIVIEGTALGHVPTTIKEYSLIPKIGEAVGSGVLVAMTTQCLFGRVNPYVYSNLREVSSRGVVYCGDMLPETAYVKMMWALGKSKNVDEARRLMLDNVAGEVSEKTQINSSH